jgi:hypothetical protein
MDEGREVNGEDQPKVRLLLDEVRPLICAEMERQVEGFGESVTLDFTLTPGENGQVFVMLVAWFPAPVMTDLLQMTLPIAPGLLIAFLDKNDFSDLVRDVLEGMRQMRSSYLAQSLESVVPSSNNGHGDVSQIIQLPGGQ